MMKTFLQTLGLALCALTTAVAAQTEFRQSQNPPSMHYILKIERNGAVSKEASIGFPQVVDQHLGLNWAARKPDAAELASLPNLAVSSATDISSMSLNAAESTLHNERLPLYSAFAQSLSAYLRAQGIQHSWVEVRQKVWHQGREKMARSTVIVQPSGWWHASFTRVRATDRPLQILYATYRARRDLNSPFEPDGIPPVSDPNENTGKMGLWVNIKRLDTWADITPPTRRVLNRVGTPAGTDWWTFSNWESTLATPDPAVPSTHVQDYVWPAKCIMDRASKNGLDPARTCPNNNDLKSLAGSADVDFVVLDYTRPSAWRMLPTATPGQFSEDFKLTVNSRRSVNICDPFDFGSYRMTQAATLTGTVRLYTDRILLSETGTAELIQQFTQDYPINYPYNSSYLFKRKTSFPQNDSCGNPMFQIGGFGPSFTLSYFTGKYSTQGYSCNIEGEESFSLIFSDLFITPQGQWWNGSAKGAMASQLNGKDPLKFIGHTKEPGLSTAHFVVAPLQSQFIDCSTPPLSCPDGQVLVNGVCTINTTSCPPGAYYSVATNTCLTCPLIGQILTGDLQCICPACTVSGIDLGTGAQACVRDPNPTLPACQTATNTCSAVSAAVGYDRMQTLPGSTRDNPRFKPGCPVCAEGHKWNSNLGSCEQEIRDMCTNIAGIQGEIPIGMTEENGICTAQTGRRFCSCGDADVTVTPNGATNSNVLNWNEIGDLSRFNGTVRVACTQFSNINNENQNNTYTFSNGRIIATQPLPRQAFRTMLCQ